LHSYRFGFTDLACIFSHEKSLAFKILNNLVEYFMLVYSNYLNFNSIMHLAFGFYLIAIKAYVYALDRLKFILYFYDLYLYKEFIKISLIFRHKLNAYAWYISVLLKYRPAAHNYYAQLVLLLNNSSNKISLLSKALLLKFSLNLNSYFNLNNFILYKFYVKSLLKYYLSVLFKVKNKMIYYKSNYYSFRKAANLGRLRKHKINISRSFLNVRTRRGYNSFYNLTFNTFFLKNLYNFNSNTYIYILNSYDIKLNIKLLFSPFIFLKYSFGNYILFVYWFLYMAFFIFAYIFYKKFFNLFFFSKKINQMGVNTEHN